jgi:lipopolysaccharide/colanic/teichoic acid biosynthesis glycosyltransferase
MRSDRRKKEYSIYLHSRTKRCFDVVISVLLLLPAVLIAAIAGLCILIREGRPVLFIHYRVGRNGWLFRMPKLRSLRVEANPYEPSVNSPNASLVTRTGKFLRRHKVDELPQLFSVLSGRMSLIGPRPELPNVALRYTSLHKKRFLARPGITGLWQIMGDHKVGMHEDLKYDLYYLRKANLWLDVKVLAMTILFVLNPK